MGKPTCQALHEISSWESRNEVKCHVRWPKSRAGHVATYDKKRGGIWIHGGFTAYYPYGPFNKDDFVWGSTVGVASAGRKKISQSTRVQRLVPYSTHPYFLDDLWFYDLSTGIWEEKKPGKFLLVAAIGCVSLA